MKQARYNCTAMEKRSAAIELAFLALFQLPQKTENINIEKLAKTDLDALCLSAIRTLADHSKDNLRQAESYFIKVERALMEFQIDHVENEALDDGSRSVTLPKTAEFFDHFPIALSLSFEERFSLPLLVLLVQLLEFVLFRRFQDSHLLVYVALKEL